MEDKKIFLGFGGVIALLILVAIIRSGGIDSGDVKQAIAADLEPVSEAVSAVDDRVNAIESAVDSKLADVQSLLESQIADVTSRLDQLTEQAEGALSRSDLEAVQSQIDAVAAQTDDISESVAELGKIAAETATSAQAAVTEPDAEDPQTSAQEPETQTTPEAAAAASDPDASGLMPGETLLLADGALRLFVSRLDAEAGQVRVMALGEMIDMRTGVGRTLPAGDSMCRVTLDAVSDSGAALSGLCGDDLPEPQGIRAGETALLNDGALRVFASRITDDSARLAANGETIALAAGGSAQIDVAEQSCTLTLAQVDRGHADVSASCE